MNVKRLAVASSLALILLASAPSARAGGIDDPIGAPQSLPIYPLVTVVLTSLGVATSLL